MLMSLSLSSTLFHYTHMRNLLRILREDQFELKTAIGTESEEAITNAYYLSTTRHRLGGYHLGKDKRGSCLIELDGAKLSQRHKGKSTDYWGGSYVSGNDRAQQHEAEDRVLSKKSVLKKATSYIKGVDLLFPNGLTKLDRDRLVVRHIIAECKKRDIPIHIYEDKQAYLLADNRNAVPLKEFFVKTEEEKKRTPRSFDFKDKKILLAYIELYFKNAFEDLSDSAKSLVRDYYRFGRTQVPDALTVLRDDMKGAKRDTQDQYKSERRRLDTLVQVMQKRKWSTEEFVEHLCDKWEFIYKKL